MSLRHYLALAAALGIGLAMALSGAQIASASHYRANQLNWHQASGNTVEFHLTGSWRCTFFFSDPCSASIGDTFFASGVDAGDGNFLSAEMTVTGVDVVNDVVTAEAHLEHTYSGPGPWTASVSDCCRLSSSNGHMNNGDGSVRYETLVDLSQTTASPVALVAPIVDCPIDALCSFTVPAADPDGQELRWRFSTDVEASGSPGGFIQPAGATINSTNGLYQWNTTGAALAPSGDTFYSTQVMVENLVGGVVVSRTAVDFFIRLGSGSSNAQPVFVDPTPADGSVINGTVGSPMSFDVAATDPDSSDVVTLAILGQPAGSSFSPTSGNPATGTFSWTPAAPGDYLITLIATDQNGLGAVPRGIILRIGTAPTNAAPQFVDPTPADGSVIDGTVGLALSFSVAATDADAGDTVTLGMTGQPAGSSFSPTAGNPATGTFDWIPSAPGDYVVTLTAADQHGATADPRTVTLRIAPAASGTSVSGHGRFNTGDGRVDFRLSNDTVSLVKSRGTKFTFTGDVDSIVGSANTATMTGTGTYNGASGYTFTIIVVDLGSPGAKAGDTIDVVIRDAAGAVVFSTGGAERLKPGDIIVTNSDPD
jgi:hypothetical protein